ncbi:hypothetical protein EI94DRAFT_1705510 [Lactarius quietus]|nr:hypothetical protein EI94DRAFT_1705510 [Lactarius quietus]
MAKLTVSLVVNLGWMGPDGKASSSKRKVHMRPKAEASAKHKLALELAMHTKCLIDSTSNSLVWATSSYGADRQCGIANRWQACCASPLVKLGSEHASLSGICSVMCRPGNYDSEPTSEPTLVQLPRRLPSKRGIWQQTADPYFRLTLA